MRLSRIICFGLVLVIVWCAGGGLIHAREAPDFTLPGLSGDSVSLSDWTGYPLIISFFTTWCPFCTEELTHLEELYQEHASVRGLRVVAVNIAEPEEKVQEMVSRLGLTYTVALDEGSGVASRYRIVGLPTSYLVNPDGTISDMIIGATRPSVWMEKLEKIFWYDGLRKEDIEDVASATSELVVLDLREEKGNPFPGHHGVRYLQRANTDNITEGLHPDEVHLIYADSNKKGAAASRKLAQEGFTMVYYQLADETEP